MSKSPADPVEEPVVNDEEGDESDEYEDIEVRQDMHQALSWSSADAVSARTRKTAPERKTRTKTNLRAPRYVTSYFNY